MIRIIDLTQLICNDMPVFPDSIPVKITDMNLYEKHGVFVQSLLIDGHTGTHLDAPKHLYKAGKSVADLDMNLFYGDAYVIDCRHYSPGSEIGPEVIEQIPDAYFPKFVLIDTGWWQKWGEADYFNDFPTLSDALIDRLLERKIKGIALDSISMDPVKSNTLDKHHRVLSAGCLIIENLTNLTPLHHQRFKFSCFPLKIDKGDGSPIRAVALIET